jgi:hypothetical protein
VSEAFDRLRSSPALRAADPAVRELVLELFTKEKAGHAGNNSGPALAKISNGTGTEQPATSERNIRHHV